MGRKRANARGVPFFSSRDDASSSQLPFLSGQKKPYNTASFVAANGIYKRPTTDFGVYSDPTTGTQVFDSGTSSERVPRDGKAEAFGSTWSNKIKEYFTNKY
ncbi:hypothetical protein K7X08_011509 [Anisodus acutangulus]|uniref:Uncharacterized protein n=1 Tax=Anisodus acutangulus TaxID=402998 RepID=A0A9Q1RIL5_9SOLA|nr:hypothetical protein K7X08_011509 [Anisodus acutangulus]